jgi:hypothetical protein
MSYTINRTDGTELIKISDGNIDQVATDLTLIGKSASAYGEFLNENLVHLLENFANATRPSHPIQGQLWYDTVEGRLKVYDAAVGFKLTGGTIVSDVVPSSISQGDIWIDSIRQQLYFNDGTATILAGPYDPAVTGFTIVEVLDIYGLPHTILNVIIGTVLFGIFSNDTFTPDSTTLGYTGIIKSGLNLTSLSTITNVTAPTDDYEVVNKLSMTNAVKLAPLSLSINITSFTGDKNALIISEYLNKVFPAGEYGVANVQGPVCRAICTDGSTVTIRQFKLIDEVWNWQFNLQ